MTLEITPTVFNIQLIATLSLEIFWTGFRLENFSPGVCVVACFTFKVATYLNFEVCESFSTFNKFSFTVFITLQMTSILWPNCYLCRVSPLFVPQIGVILLPFFALAMWGLSTCLSIWSSKSDLHHHGYPLKAYRAEVQFIPWWYSLVSLMYVSFLRLDDQMRLPFGPDYCRHYCIFLPGTYQVILFSSTGIGLEVCLWWD